MNTRSRELAIQASIWCEENAKGAPTAWEWEDKFAELIVQECANLCLDRFLGIVPSSGEHFNLKIKNHFGIE